MFNAVNVPQCRNDIFAVSLPATDRRQREEGNVYLHRDDMDYYSSLLNFCTIDGALKSIPLYFPPPNLYYSSSLSLPPLAFGAQPSAVTGCHSFISSLHHSFCPSEDVGIHLSIHLSASFSLTSGNDEERQRGEGYKKKRERRSPREGLWKMGTD